MSGFSQVWHFTTAATTRTVSVVAGWNLLSVPLAVSDYLKSTLFPTAISSAFTFVPGIGYEGRDTLLIGVGYWLKFAADQDISFSGSPISVDTVAVAGGWNLFGAISTSLGTSGIATIPSGIRASQIFGYSDGYVFADSILVGQGYWVKVSAPGMLILSAPLTPSGSKGKPLPSK